MTTTHPHLIKVNGLIIEPDCMYKNFFSSFFVCNILCIQYLANQNSKIIPINYTNVPEFTFSKIQPDT